MAAPHMAHHTAIRDLLGDAARAGAAPRDAQHWLAHLLGQPRHWLLSHDGDAVSPEVQVRFAEGCAQLASGMPLAYLTGCREFHGLMLQVQPGVLVPRPDTETLVDGALKRLKAISAAQSQPAVLDLGTGTGAVALAIKHRWPAAQVTAIDLDAQAVLLARRNGERLGLGIEVLQGDWFAPVAGRRFELIVSNPPYIAAGDPHLAALTHEPRSALVGGTDGLQALAHLVSAAPAHLAAGGWLLLEHGWDQGDPVARMLADAGLADAHSERDLAGHRRCSGGRWRV
jgi:release factor glutamine methyltransferase